METALQSTGLPTGNLLAVDLRNMALVVLSGGSGKQGARSVQYAINRYDKVLAFSSHKKNLLLSSEIKTEVRRVESRVRKRIKVPSYGWPVV